MKVLYEGNTRVWSPVYPEQYIARIEIEFKRLQKKATAPPPRRYANGCTCFLGHPPCGWCTSCWDCECCGTECSEAEDGDECPECDMPGPGPA